jgi:carbon storage regulator
MLVLSRKRGEMLVLDGNIIVRVLGITRNRVQLGVDAPEEIPVWRGERQGEGAAAVIARACHRRPAIEEPEYFDFSDLDLSALENIDLDKPDDWLDAVPNEDSQAVFD